MTLTQNTFCGWQGETAVTLALNSTLDPSIYRRLNNLIIPENRNGTAQIDHVLVSVFGIFVVETKNYSGRIFGNANSAEWFQETHGTSRPFPNPLRQNYSHVKALAELLDCPEFVFEPVVFFIGDCAFRTSMPINVMSSGLVPYICSFGMPRLTRQKVDETVARLRVHRGSTLRLIEHIRNVRARMDAAEPCPRCGHGVLRQRTSGCGVKFWGCSQYPACRYTRSLQAPFPQEHFLVAIRRARLQQKKGRTCSTSPRDTINRRCERGPRQGES